MKHLSKTPVILRTMTFLLALNCLLKFNAQNCCPFLYPSTLIPQTPSQHDLVKVVTRISTNSASYKLNGSFSVDSLQKIIDIQLCYFYTVFLSVPTHIDTFHVGTLSPGVYTTNITAIQTFSNPCTTYSQNTSSFTFTVYDNPVSVLNQLPERTKYELFPNPAKSTVRITNSEGAAQAIKNVMIFNSMGQLVLHERNYIPGTEIDIGALARGIYFLQISGLRSRPVKIIKL